MQTLLALIIALPTFAANGPQGRLQKISISQTSVVLQREKDGEELRPERYPIGDVSLEKIWVSSEDRGDGLKTYCNGRLQEAVKFGALYLLNQTVRSRAIYSAMIPLCQWGLISVKTFQPPHEFQQRVLAVDNEAGRFSLATTWVHVKAGGITLQEKDLAQPLTQNSAVQAFVSAEMRSGAAEPAAGFYLEEIK